MCADKGGANRCEAAIDNTPALQRVVLLSAVGGTKDAKSFFGGGENAIKTGEEALLKTVAARGIDLSVCLERRPRWRPERRRRRRRFHGGLQWAAGRRP